LVLVLSVRIGSDNMCQFEFWSCPYIHKFHCFQIELLCVYTRTYKKLLPHHSRTLIFILESRIPNISFLRPLRVGEFHSCLLFHLCLLPLRTDNWKNNIRSPLSASLLVWLIVVLVSFVCGLLGLLVGLLLFGGGGDPWRSLPTRSPRISDWFRCVFLLLVLSG
jgi:hypothetical protein